MDSSTSVAKTRPVRPYAASATCLSGASVVSGTFLVAAAVPVAFSFSTFTVLRDVVPTAVGHHGLFLVHIFHILSVGTLYLKKGMV